MNTITQILDLPESATADDICTAVTTLKNSVLSPQSSRLKAALKLPPAATADEICAAAESLAARLGSQSSEIATLQNSIASHNSQFTTERTARIDLILTNAVEKGRITLAQRDEWKTKLEAELEKDLAAAETQLANTAPALNTISLTRDLGNEKAAYDTEATRRAALIGYIAEQQTKGLTYDEAWAKSKLECSEIFEKMVRN